MMGQVVDEMIREQAEHKMDLKAEQMMTECLHNVEYKVA